MKELHGQRVLCSSEPSEAELLSVLQDHPDGMMLTVTRAAATTINRIAVNNLFPDVDPCGYVKYDGTDKFQPIYKGMRVIITQNRDKDLHIVNGKTATVHTMQNATLFLKLSNEHIVAVYPVTAATVDDHRRTSNPFVPAYASTICKIQGQNLGKVILWLDTPLVPKGSALYNQDAFRTVQPN